MAERFWWDSVFDDPAEGWQCIQQQLTISAGNNAAIQDRHSSSILLGPQQPTNRLDEFDGRVRNGDFHKRIAAPLRHPLGQARLNGIIRHRKWQTGNHDVVQVLAEIREVCEGDDWSD